MQWLAQLMIYFPSTGCEIGLQPSYESSVNLLSAISFSFLVRFFFLPDDKESLIMLVSTSCFNLPRAFNSSGRTSWKWRRGLGFLRNGLFSLLAGFNCLFWLKFANLPSSDCPNSGSWAIECWWAKVFEPTTFVNHYDFYCTIFVAYSKIFCKLSVSF